MASAVSGSARDYNSCFLALSGMLASMGLVTSAQILFQRESTTRTDAAGSDRSTASQEEPAKILSWRSLSPLEWPVIFVITMSHEVNSPRCWVRHLTTITEGWYRNPSGRIWSYSQLPKGARFPSFPNDVEISIRELGSHFQQFTRTNPDLK